MMSFFSVQEFAIVGLFICGINVLFMTIFPIRMLWYKSLIPQKKKSYPLSMISIVTYIKEVDYLTEESLYQIMGQDYLSMEIILVNHGTDYQVKEKLERLVAKTITRHKVKIIDVAHNDNFGVDNIKYALTLGIKSAIHPNIILMLGKDIPESDEWALEYGCAFDQKNLLIGHNSYTKKNGLLNMIYRYQRLKFSSFSFPLSMMKVAHLTQGNCIGFSKDLFMEVSGYYSHMQRTYGINNLFINDAKQKANIGLITNHKSLVRSPSPKFKKWLSNLREEAYTTKHYKFSVRMLLGLSHFIDISWVLLLSTSLILSCTSHLPWKVTLPLFILRYFFYTLVMVPVAFKFREKDLIKLLPLLEIATIIFKSYALLSSKLYNTSRHHTTTNSLK